MSVYEEAIHLDNRLLSSLGEKTVYHWPPKPTAADAKLHLQSVIRQLEDIRKVMPGEDNVEVAKAIQILEPLIRR